MNLISLLGLVSLLLLAWAISYHRNKVKLRPIIWGMGLQFLLAMVILNQDWVSYLGISLLGLVLTVYTLQNETFTKMEGPPRIAAHIGIAAAIGVAFYFLHALIPLHFVLFAIIGVLLLNGFYLKKPPVQQGGAAALFAGGAAWLIAAERNGRDIFSMFSDRVEDFLALSDYGAEFIFGNLAREEYFFAGNEYFPGFGFLFAFKVLPTIIFFGGFMSVLYYLGVMQRLIGAMSKFMRWTLGTSGSESLSCSANVFVGQTEAPLLIKPFLQDMTPSELLTIMVGGFATIAGGVLAGYINMGVDAGHLIAASVMSAPAALVMAKIIYPELEHSKTAGDVEVPEIDSSENILEAAANGISDGFKLALNVGAMLIGFIALIAVVDVTLNWMDGIIDGQLLGGALREYDFQGGSSPVTQEYAGIFPGSLQTLFGTILSPLAWLMGVPWEDAPAVANLLGIKLSLNEFVAFANLGVYIQDGVLSERGTIIATYALCGFANFSSIGIQLGGLSALAPERKRDLAKVVLKAMCGGAFASWTTACVAGIML